MIEEGDAVEYCTNMQEKEEENEGARLNQRQSQDKRKRRGMMEGSKALREIARVKIR